MKKFGSTDCFSQLSDEEYLDRYIESLNLLYPDEIWGIKNKDSICIATTSIKARMVGCNSVDDAIGLKDEDYRCKTAEVAEIFYSQDYKVIFTKRNLHIIDIHEYCTGLAFLKTTKKPIINPYTNNVLGTFNFCIPFTPNTNLTNILDINGIRFGKHSSMKISNDSNKFKLTEMERNVLFCICLGINSRKDIAYLLSAIYKREISAETTINDAFRRLYQKLGCNTPAQLLEFAEYNNLNLEIPKNFLATGLYIIS